MKMQQGSDMVTLDGTGGRMVVPARPARSRLLMGPGQGLTDWEAR